MATEDGVLVQRIIAGDELAFEEVVRSCGPSMFRVSRGILKSDALAEEVVQDAWMAALRALPSFEARSSLKTWLTTIAANAAKRRLKTESRTVASGAMTGDDDDVHAHDFDANGRWREMPTWTSDAIARIEMQELRAVVEQTLASLPPLQAAVLTLRDLEGCEPDEVCRALDISDANQRVLLHRARTRVRKAWLEREQGRGR